MSKIREKKELTASFTVEAAMVMPIVLFVVIALLYMSFYLHDLCVIRSISDQMVSELCHIKESGVGRSVKESGTESWVSENLSMLGVHLSDEDKSLIYSIMEDSLKGKLFLFSYEGCGVNVSFQRVTLQVETKISLLSGTVQGFLPSSEIRTVSYGTVHQPSVSVRAEKLVFSEFERTKVFDNIQSLLSKVREYIF